MQRIERERQEIQKREAAERAELQREQEASRKRQQEHAKQMQREAAAEAARKKAREQELQEQKRRIEQAAQEAKKRFEEQQARIARDWPKPAWFSGYDEHVNVGFVGGTGVGKSSLINFVLGLANGDARAAKTDVVECTMRATPFTKDSATMWDLPGAGTENFPRDNYIKQMGLRYFDALVIITATRFTEIDTQLFREARAWEIPCYLLRNKADQALEDEEDDKGVPPAQTLARLEAELLAQMRANGSDATGRAFVVTTKRRKYPEALGPQMTAFLRAITAEIEAVRARKG